MRREEFIERRNKKEKKKRGWEPPPGGFYAELETPTSPACSLSARLEMHVMDFKDIHAEF